MIKVKKRLIFNLVIVMILLAMAMAVPVSGAEEQATIKGETIPTSISYGDSFTVKGKITSTIKLNYVRAGVVDSKNSWVPGSNAKVDPKAKNYDLAKIDSKIKFGNVKPGNYTYKIRIRDTSGTVKNLVSRPFKVTFASGSKITSIDNVSRSALSINWKKLGGAEGYKLYKVDTTTGKATLEKNIKDGNVTGYQDTGLNYNESYSYKVRSYQTASGTTYYGKYSPERVKKVINPPPTIKKITRRQNNITVTWKNVEGSVKYKLYRAIAKAPEKAGPYKEIAKTSKTEFVDENVDPEETYYYKTRSYETPSTGTVYGTYSGMKYSVATKITGQGVVDFACQFVGNPYVYGGTSLTNGADCSGFIQTVYKQFGITLPRSSGEMGKVGVPVIYNPVTYQGLQPGDIMAYPGHVSIFIGDGQIVHASTPAMGIKISSASYRKPTSVRRVIPEIPVAKVK
ncbi:MAG: C40 family peptidase [Anaerovoracaceae bacterium]